MTELEQNESHQLLSTAFGPKLARSLSQVSCTPLWMYKMGDAIADFLSTDQLPDGYATSVGYGERFRNSEYLPLFGCYPFLPFLLILGCLMSLGGIAFAIYRWRTGTAFNRYLHCKISKETRIWFYLNYFLLAIVSIFLIFTVTIMLTANNNIADAKEERALHLELADRSIEKITNRMGNANFEDPLYSFNELSRKLLRAIESKTQPHLKVGNKKIDELDFMMYKDDIQELLQTFDHCNAYMLHFLDSWRYYDTNATKFAMIVDTMDSRRALQSLRQVREDFASVVYKVIQQNRAFYNYHRQLEILSEDVTANHSTDSNKNIKYANTLNIHLKNVEDKLDRLGTKLQERTIKMKTTTDYLQKTSDGTGYIEFPKTISGFGYFVCISMLLIVFLSLSFMPLWYFAKYYRRIAFLRGILPLTTAALIFAFYSIFVLAIMYYFLYGMVAKDGICEGKRGLASLRSNLIDDCLNNSTIFDALSPANYDKNMAEIEKVLQEIENMPKRDVASQSINDFETFRVNKTVIQDIYVEMLKVSVYAPKNIEPFGLIWYANHLSTNKILQQLNCTHAIGNTMATSLHGQVASEMDKLYRTTWRIESIVRDLPNQLRALNRHEPANLSTITNTSENLQSIFIAHKEQLRTSIYRATTEQFVDCKPVAQLYKGLIAPSCKCMVRSMNLFWFGGVLSSFLLLLLLALLLWLEEMLRRSCSHMNRHSSRRRSFRKSRGRSRTRSSNRPGTAHSSRTHTPYSTGKDTPYSTRQNTPYSSHPDTPYSTRATTPHSSRPNTPYSSHRATPYSSHRGTPYTSQRTSAHSSKPETPNSIHARSPERTPTRGTGLAQKRPPNYDPFLIDHNRAVQQDPLADRFTERLSRRDVLPRHQQRKHHYPSLGQRDMKDYLTFESYPALPDIAHQQTPSTKERAEPKPMWKNDTFRYPGLAGSDLSTNHPNYTPKSISKVLERRGKSQPNERHISGHHSTPHRTIDNDGEQPTTSRTNAKSLPLPPGKVGIVLCPCGCGKPSKIYGTKDDIERIRKAGRICIAKRGEHLINKNLRPLASVVQLNGDEPDEDIA